MTGLRYSKPVMISVSLLALAGIAVGGIITGGPYLLQSALRSNGFPEATIDGLRFTPSGAYIRHIALEAKDQSSQTKQKYHPLC